ncbi:uncharacterized protein TNCV_2668261 [Trichonephila clavipes]|nr:uncharacterized protein TNCV_2668261 [Trichonephila clavipes]
MRLCVCGDLIYMEDGDRNFSNNIVTGDESWCLMYDPESKRQSLEWQSPSSTKKIKVRSKKSRIKTMLTAFLDSTAALLKFWGGITLERGHEHIESRKQKIISKNY